MMRKKLLLLLPVSLIFGMIAYAQDTVATPPKMNPTPSSQVASTSTDSLGTSTSDSLAMPTDSSSTTATKTVDTVVKTAVTTTEVKKITKTTESCTIPSGTLLQKGSKDAKNKYVMRLQDFLHKSGYLKATPNGFFGAGTYAGVRAFQKEYGYMVTGIVGPYSLAKVNELSCGMANTLENYSVSKASPVKTVTKKVTTAIVTTPPAEAVDSTSNSLDRPVIISFSMIPTSAGDQVYDAKIINADSISIKATCPVGIIEVKNLVGLTKEKIADSDSVCRNEKYLLLNDANQALVLERKQSQLVFTDREGQPSWFSFDSSSTPVTNLVPYTIKACLKNVCVQRSYTAKVSDSYKKVVATELSLSGVKVDSAKNLFLNAYNVNTVTVKAGCPYNTQAVDSTGVILSDAASPCNVEKSILSSPTTLVTTFEKSEGLPLSSFGYNFELKTINGEMDPYSTIELNVKACSGVQADSISSTTLRCIEKSAYMPVYPKQVASSTK